MCLYLCYFILEFSGVAEKNTICSFYDFDSLNWSNKGCYKNLENSGWYYYIIIHTLNKFDVFDGQNPLET